MLVLTRKANQQIRLGDDITITILRVNNGSIRIGIEAPRDVRVLRGEIERFEDSEPAEAAQPSATESEPTTVVPQATASRRLTGSKRAGNLGASPQCAVRARLGGESSAAVDDLLGEAAEGQPLEVYELRTRISVEDAAATESAGSANQRDTKGKAAPLARFLPPLPPTVQESSARYAV